MNEMSDLVAKTMVQLCSDLMIALDRIGPLIISKRGPICRVSAPMADSEWAEEHLAVCLGRLMEDFQTRKVVDYPKRKPESASLREAVMKLRDYLVNERQPSPGEGAAAIEFAALLDKVLARPE